MTQVMNSKSKEYNKFHNLKNVKTIKKIVHKFLDDNVDWTQHNFSFKHKDEVTIVTKYSGDLKLLNVYGGLSLDDNLRYDINSITNKCTIDFLMREGIQSSFKTIYQCTFDEFVEKYINKNDMFSNLKSWLKKLKCSKD